MINNWRRSLARTTRTAIYHETANSKVRKAEDGWNTRNPEQVALAYTEDSRWRNRAEFINGRHEIVGFLKHKWSREVEYRLIKELLWALREIGSLCDLLTNGATFQPMGPVLRQ